MENIWVTLIQSIFTFLGVYVATRESNKKSLKKLENKVDRLVSDNEEQHKDILRLTVFEDNLPVSERIIAGDKYLKKGGNGDTKKFYMQMLAEHTK